MTEATYAAGAILMGAILTAGLTTPWAMRIAAKIGAIDMPGHLKIHDQPIPRLGGVGIYLTALTILLGLLAVGVGQLDTALAATLAGTALIAVVGFIDDVRGLPQTSKFVVEGLIAGACIYFLADQMTWWLAPLAWLWIMGLLNAYNFIDGMDGLFAGTAAVNLLALGVLFLLAGRPLPALLSLGCGGALLGFLRFNWEPARIFMGDGGALGVGFLIASLSVLYVDAGGFHLSKTIAVLLAAALPVGDVVFTLIRRLIQYRTLHPGTVFQGDRFHFYDQMQNNAGMRVRTIVVIAYAVAAGLAGVGIYVRDLPQLQGAGVGAVAAMFMIGIAALCKVRIPRGDSSL